jgi:hypothetical protein
MKKNNIISDWLDKYGDPEIEKRVEERLLAIERDRLKKEHTQELKDYINDLQEKYLKEDVIMNEEKPFIVYLDIDGVLVSYLKLRDFDDDGRHSFVPKAVETLNSIISMFDAHICVVSTWGRSYRDKPDEFKDFLISRGIIVNGLTIGDCDDRAGYVLKMKSEGYRRFLIIDDEVLEYYKRVSEIGYNRILYSNSWRCLDEYDLVGVSRNFNRINGDEYPEKLIN